MDNLFIILFLIFLASTIAVFIRPSQFLKNKTGPEIKKTKMGLVLLTIVFFVLFGVSSDAPKQNKTQSKPDISKSPENKAEEPTPTKSPQEILDETLSNTVGSNMNYRGIKTENADPDRPKDTKMITVSVGIKGFLTKSSLLRNTDGVSSEVFRVIFGNPSLNAYDVVVWYYGETTDKYGNKNDDLVLTYAIDKVTYDKINWQNFDRFNLCNFLEQDAKVSGTFDTGCKVLVNIQ